LWFNWDNQDRPWKDLLRHHDKTDQVLFFASTMITIGNGKNTPFWESRWLGGMSPKDLAPNLCKQACFKYRTVHKELQGFSWIKNLRQISTEELLDEFVLLFILLSEVQLTYGHETIAWKWTREGQYSASSAYDIQFQGAVPSFKTSTIWQAKTEPKCKFFAWLAALGKALTSDNLLKKNWPADPFCPLCFCQTEMVDHLFTECNFTEAVWDRTTQFFQVHQSALPFQKERVKDWLDAVDRIQSKVQQMINAGIILTFWWQIWKERN
jgi:hypothetical protein